MHAKGEDWRVKRLPQPLARGNPKRNFIFGYKSCQRSISEEGSGGRGFEKGLGRIVDGVCITEGKESVYSSGENERGINLSDSKSTECVTKDENGSVR